MIKKLLTRILILVTAGLMVYFSTLTVENPNLRIDQNQHLGQADPNHLGWGDGARYNKYDGEGNLITSGTSQKTTRTKDDRFILEKVRISHLLDKRRFSVDADNMETAEDGRIIMSTNEAEPDSLIVLVERGGIRIETRGPLIQNTDQTISTEAPARFTLGASSGSCIGLRYLSNNYLELAAEVTFNDRTKEGVTQVEAAYLRMDYLEATGLIREGIVTTNAPGRKTLLLADEINVVFRSGVSDGSLAMDSASLIGEQASFIWGNGEMQASRFDICFSSNGRWAEELRTGADAVFSAATADGYWLSGQAGSMLLEMIDAEPKLLSTEKKIRIIGNRAGAPQLSLHGEQGMATDFIDGSVASTRIFGTPKFAYGSMTGNAGSLRVRHNEHQILFNGGANLEDSSQHVRIKGDEILLTGWDLKEKEIYAFTFVEIVYTRPDQDEVQGFGEKLEMHLAGNFVKLEGKPARFQQLDETVEAEAIEVVEIDDGVFDLETLSHVTLTKITEEGEFRVEAQKMSYDGTKRQLQFDAVLKAVTPGAGEFSCDRLEIGLKRGTGREAVDSIVARRNIIFKHVVVVEGGTQPATCLADLLTYDLDKDLAIFEGIDRDVVITREEGVLKMGRLIYNVKDGSVSGYPEREGESTITVPIKGPDQRKD